MAEIRALAFDFDGVILDGEEFRIEAFKSLFTSFPDQVEAIDAYNRVERGVNRRTKFEYIYANILHLPYDSELIEGLATHYGAALAEGILDLPLIPGIKEFLGSVALPKFVASSSERHELENILQHHGILDLFTDIYCNPYTKPESLAAIAERLAISPSEILFFGDAIKDYEASQAVGTQFIARSHNPTLFPDSVTRIPDFTDFSL